MRLMVGDDGSATVGYGPDRKRNYDAAGAYTILPARCDDNDRKQDDESRKEDTQSQAQDGTRGQAGQDAPAVWPVRSLWEQLGIIGGAAVAGAIATDQQGNSVAPDHPISR